MVIVTPTVAVGLVALIEPGRRQLRADGMRMPEGLAATVFALEALVKVSRGEGAASSAAPVTWVRTVDAARRIGVSQEAVRKAALTGRLLSRRVGRLVEVSESSLMLWAEDRAA